jgi:hypothetical protein
MSDDRCKFCIDKWICKGICSRCDHHGCEYNRQGYCLDVNALKDPTKQTGCIASKGKDIRIDDDTKADSQ